MTTNGPQALRLQCAEAADMAAKLARKWQSRMNWSMAAEFARVLFECQLTEAETLHYANALQQEQSDLSILHNLVREYLPAMLHLSPPVDFLHEYKTLDADRRIRDLCELEGRILSEKQTPDAVAKSGSRQSEIPVVRTFSKWQELLSWSPTTWARRRKDFPECFTDVPGENACSIREAELNLWLASAENKNRSPFEKP